MKTIKYLLMSLTFFAFNASFAQNMEVEGEVKLMQTDLENAEDLLLAKKADGTVVSREVGSLPFIPEIDPDLIPIPDMPKLSSSLFFGANLFSIAHQNNYVYIVSIGDGLKIVDVSNPISPSLTGTLSIVLPVRLAVKDNYVYLLDQNLGELHIIDVSIPATPSISSSLAIGSSPRSVVVDDNYAYVVDIGSNDLKIINISNPASPAITGSLALGNPMSVDVDGNYAYVVDQVSQDLKIIDVSNPAVPTITGSLAIGSSPISVDVDGNYAYVVDTGSDDLKIINISNPAAPAITGSLAIGSSPTSLVVSENYAYIVDNGSQDLKVINLAPPHLLALDYEGNIISLGKDFDNDAQNELSDLNLASDILTLTNPATGGNQVDLSTYINTDDWSNTGNNIYYDTGNVGIGTTSPTSPLHIFRSTGQVRPVLESGLGNTDVHFILKNSDGETWSAGLHGNTSNFRITATGNLNTPSTLFTILPTGEVGIGATSPSHPLELSSGAHCTGGGVWTNASDRNKKYNINDLSYGLSDVMKMNPRSYSYKSDDSESIGFIAQEMKDIIPEVVSGEDGNMGLSYGLLTAVLVNAIQEQQEMILELRMKNEELRVENSEIRTQNSEMGERLSKIETALGLTIDN